MTERDESNMLLNLLADKLDTIPTDRFQYERWFGLDFQGHEDLSCGTPACAMGWAATMPEMKARGLHIVGRFSSAAVALHDPNDPDNPWEGMMAAAKLFGILYDQANYLFSPVTTAETYATPGLVAEKIRRFIKERD